jgi:hypothetical protein
MYNDAKACFDRIIENLANMALQREGYPVEVARLHSQTMLQIKYYIKHKLGIGTIPNQHSATSPFLGSGQGATDSPARWGFISDALIRSYKKLAHQAIIRSPSSRKQINQQIQAFVDDTRTLFLTPTIGIMYLQHLLAILQEDSQAWEKLVYTTGGKLEVSKCKFGLFQWQYSTSGEPSLVDGDTLQLSVTSSEDQQNLLVNQLSPSTSYKYLGMHIALDGNMWSQEQSLQQLCDKFIIVFAQSSFSTMDIHQCYTTVFAPAIKYVFPGTSLSESFLYKLQLPILNLVLPKLGFNQHMPRDVVLAPLHFGGLGLMDLYVEQGVAHIMFILGQIRSFSPAADTILILLESYQISSGLPDNPFQFTKVQSYVSSPWVQSVQQFLCQCNATIALPGLHIIGLLRQNDAFIMHTAVALGFSASDLSCINQCRLFLQVMTLSEICNDNGDHILLAALEGHTSALGTPSLQVHSQSTLQWPDQPRPEAASWRIWRRFLQHLLSSHSTPGLIQPLGQWLHNTHPHRKWTYQYDPTSNEVTQQSGTMTVRYIAEASRTRQTHVYRASSLLGPTSITFPVTPTVVTDKILHKIPLDLGDKCPILMNLTSLRWIHQNQTVCLRKTILNIYNSKIREFLTMTG